MDSAFDGEETLDFLSEYEYDAIILDIMMPKIYDSQPGVLEIANMLKIFKK